MAAHAAMSSSRTASASASTAAGPSARQAERAIHAPGEVHRGRPGGAEASGAIADGRVVAREPGASSATPIAPATPSAGRAAHGQPPDRVDQRIERRDPQHDQLVGEPGLVDEADLAVDPVDRPHGPPIFAGGRTCPVR